MLKTIELTLTLSLIIAPALLAIERVGIPGEFST